MIISEDKLNQNLTEFLIQKDRHKSIQWSVPNLHRYKIESWMNPQQETRFSYKSTMEKLMEKLLSEDNGPFVTEQ